MIIIGSAKTLKEEDLDYSGDIYDNSKTDFLVNMISDFSKEDLGDTLKIKGKTLDKVHDYYSNFHTKVSAPAILKYDGVVFKQLKSLEDNFENENYIEYIKNRVYIISALYGFINGMQQIKDYRLDFTNSKFLRDKLDINLYKYWQEYISSEINKISPNSILNLASAEYFKAIDKSVLENIDVYDIYCEDKLDSYSLKKIRGDILNYCLQNKIEDYSELIDVEFETIKFTKLEGTKLVFQKT